MFCTQHLKDMKVLGAKHISYHDFGRYFDEGVLYRSAPRGASFRVTSITMPFPSSPFTVVLNTTVYASGDTGSCNEKQTEFTLSNEP